MRMTALLSDCGTYRYWLKRVWDDARPLLVVCMLNPSTADASMNDPTILTLIHFARLWGAGGLYVVNEYAFRSPHPSVMAKAADPTGPGNSAAIEQAVHYARSTTCWALAAWGNGGRNDGLFSLWAAMSNVQLMALGTTKDGSPKHPLARGVHRIPRDQQPLLWMP